ncbi:MAG: hypothetical protein KatS3mg098_089 [Candidatus Parcubacteria bacterium]|nr:MAG: hypothetical protein KatS3mg098_089 [Candidatus Parcubacteria bacterium]
MEKFYITTTIPYMNGRLHIGHTLEFIQADVLARFARAQQKEVFFLTGSDEHGLKIAQTAAQLGLSPKKFVDENSRLARNLKKVLNLSWDSFIRTTDKKRHWPGVFKIWQELKNSGDLYKKIYRGLYCSGCEAFVTEKDLVNGRCALHQKEPELIEEENYFFRLSVYGKTLRAKIESGEFQIFPSERANEILALIDKGLEDVSFSRPKSKLRWGIPVPDDDSQVIYVWADALSNYLSAIGYGRNEEEFEKWWPADVQVLGKDVLRFHAAIWPAMLLSAKLPLPKKLLVHGFINIEGQKISKSLGNVIYPEELVEKYGTDAVRYYFLREISPFEDGDFSDLRFKERYNADLAKGLGNFVSRITTLAASFGKIKNDFSFLELFIEQKIKSAQKNIAESLEKFEFNNALAEIWSLISLGDQYINQQKPWDQTETLAKREKTLFNLLILLNAVGVFLTPFLPQTAKIITSLFSLKSKFLKVRKVPPLFLRLK